MLGMVFTEVSLSARVCLRANWCKASYSNVRLVAQPAMLPGINRLWTAVHLVLHHSRVSDPLSRPGGSGCFFGPPGFEVKCLSITVVNCGLLFTDFKSSSVVLLLLLCLFS